MFISRSHKIFKYSVHAFLQSVSGSTHQSQQLVFLLRSLLSSHALSPTLNHSAFQSLFEAFNEVASSTLALSGQDEQQGISEASQSSSGPSRLPVEQRGIQLADPLQAVVLDVIWAVDLEIDLRRQLAEALDTSDLSNLGTQNEPKGKTKGAQSPLDAALGAKARIADLVRMLIVSRSGRCPGQNTTTESYGMTWFLELL